MVVAEDWAQDEGVDVGSTLTLQTPSGRQTFEVVGIVQSGGRVSFGKLFIPPGSMTGQHQTFSSTSCRSTRRI